MDETEALAALQGTLLPHALTLAGDGYPVFALNGKTPYGNCHECDRKTRNCACEHLLCHGFKAATTERTKLIAMWHLHPMSNIGLRPGPEFFVLDVDPRNGGTVPDDMPPTLTAISGREDGGLHLYLVGEAPRHLPAGLDVKGWGGYVVAPPSVHPETGQPYRWVDYSAPKARFTGKIRNDLFNKHTDGLDTPWMGHLDVPGTWPDVLEPHGWREPVEGDWLHPQASTALSARVVDDLLYVFTNNTVFSPTQGGAPRGYNRLEAYALLNDTDILTALKEISE